MRTRRARRIAPPFSFDNRQVLRRIAVARVDETPQSIECFQSWPPSKRFDLLITSPRRPQVSHSYERGFSILVVHFFLNTFKFFREQTNVLARVVCVLTLLPQRLAQLQLITA